MMEMSLRPLLADEQKFTFGQSEQLILQIGAIGHLRGDFSSDEGEFSVMWFDDNEKLKSDVFKAELNDVVNSLRFREDYNVLINNINAIQSYAKKHPSSIIAGTNPIQYGFRIDTADFCYLVRCQPTYGTFNSSCWCFVKSLFDRHVHNARKGIRFITTDNKEIFRIPDGDMIRVIQNQRLIVDNVCRYIDDCHFEIGNVWAIGYHISDFAKEIASSGDTVIPLRSSLPPHCYTVIPSTGELIIVKKGERGHYKTEIPTTGKAEALEIAEEYNANLGVSKAQAAAMQAGSKLGWAVPAADPANYDENGQLLKPKPKHRMRDSAR